MDAVSTEPKKRCVLYAGPGEPGVCPGPDGCEFHDADGCLLAPLGLSLQTTRAEAHPVLGGWRIAKPDA